MNSRAQTGLSIEVVIQRIGEIGIIPVIRAATPDEASRAVEAICAGGIPIVEITMTVPDAAAVIRRIVRQYENRALVGAGTVLTADQAKMCLDAGAEFLVSPGLSIPVLSTASACGKLAIPGVLTPTEIMQAREHGATLIKVFPCGNVGGPKYLKSLMAPFPHVRLIPTGSINASNAAEYIAAGAFALGVGADLVDATALRSGNLARISAAASELVEAVRSARARSRAVEAQ